MSTTMVESQGARTANKPHRVRMATHAHRILIYTTCYNILDGVTLTIRKIEQEILAAGHHVCVLTTKSGDSKNTHLDGEHANRQVMFLDNAIPIPFLADPNNEDLSYQLGFSLSRSTREKIEEFEPSLIHITVPDCTCLHLIQYARDKEIPLMGTFHSNIPEYMDHYPGLSWLKHILGAFFRHQYNFLQALYVPTPFIHKHLCDTYKLDKVTNLGIWGRGIDLEKFTPSNRSMKFRRNLGIADDAVVVAWVGRVVPEKRPDIFAHVIRQLHRKKVNYHALVIGAGPSEEELIQLPNSTFLGWLSGDDLRIAYASSDVFLFPSAVETFGNVTLEAAASGLPLVVEAGCSGHLVDDGVNGYACHGDDIEAYYEGTYNLVTNHELRASFSRASRELSLPLEKRKVVQKMLENYSTVTDEFYIEYGGHHENRDIAFTHEHSFTGGTHPRPLLLQSIEFLFILIFQIMWYAVSAVFWIHGTLMSRFIPHHVTAPPPPLPTISKKQVQDVEQGSADSDQLTCDTASTASNETDEDSVDSSFACLRKRPSLTACLGDCKVSHTLAILFARTVLVQFRVESYIRNTVGGCFSLKKWREYRRKRKDSLVGKERCDSGSSVGSQESLCLLQRGDEELGRRVRSHALDV